MKQKLLKILCFLLSVMLIMTLLLACDGGKVDDPPKERTISEEYVRVASLDGENIVFDIFKLNMLKIEQSNTVNSSLIRSANDGQPLKESMVFEIDRTNPNKTLSYGKQHFLTNLSFGEFGNNIKHGIREDAFNGNYSILGGYYKSYEDYVQNQGSVLVGYYGTDYAYKNAITLFDIQKLEKIEGEKDAKSGVYSIDCQIKAEYYKDFYDYYLSVFPYLHYKNLSVPSEPSYLYFDPSKITAVKFSIKTALVGLLELNVEIDITSFFLPLETVKLTGTTVITNSDFSVTVPESTPPNWE